MEIDLAKLMMNKSEEDLQKYIADNSRYTPEAIEAAIAETQRRGQTLSDQQLATLRNQLHVKREAVRAEELALSPNHWEQNVVEDEAAPVYYSEHAIYMFSAFFSVLFGSVLLAINVQSTASRTAVWEVLGFGMTYTAIQMWLLSMLPGSTLLTLAFSGAGAIWMNYWFWRKHIGKDTKYRKKSILTPLLVGLVICAIVVFAVIYGN